MGSSLRVASVADLDALTAVMTTAFAEDPVWGAYSFPDTPRSLAQPATFWRAYLAAMLRLPSTLVTPGCEAAAVWVPPDEPELTTEQEDELDAVLRELLGDRQAAVVLDVFHRLDAAHPAHEPHHYLSLLATHSDHRGRGIGMALLAACLERVDAEGAPAYLESTNPANDARYMRHGFEPYGRVELPDGPMVTTMWRPARRPRAAQPPP
jgi:GNAT superfamily N-acetyltransferase